MKRWEADNRVPGLGVMVLPSGTKTWYLRYREPNGKQQTHKIGRADVVSRTMAREEAHKLLADVARGQTPTTARKALRSAPTVSDLHDRVTKDHYAKLRERTRHEYERLWQVHVIPELGHMKITHVERKDVIGLLQTISPVQANRVLQMLKAAFNKAELWQLRTEHTNPCVRVPRNEEQMRERYLTTDEAERLNAALDAFATKPLRWRFTQLIRLLLMTGCRVGEIVRGRWEWFDEDAAVLLIPAANHKSGKNGKKRKVHLAPAAITILKQLKERSDSDWIIDGSGDKHLVGYQKLWEELLRHAKITDLRIHDLRHHYASVGISRAGLSLTEVGKLLGHASPVTTQRYAHLVDKAAAEAAAKVAGLINP